MDHMEFSIALPPLVELTNAGMEWNTMKQRLYTHFNPNLGSNPHRGYGLRRPFLISIATEQVQGIFNMYDVSYEEATKFSKILQNIEDLCLPRFLIIYNRFRFFTCKQNGPEFNGFLQQLMAWSDLCEFGDLKDILLKDCIISGILDESIRQHLLRTEQLDFEKTVEICRAGFAKKQLTDDFKPSNKIFIDVSTDTDNADGEFDDRDTEKFDVATNTCLEVNEKAVQTYITDHSNQLIDSDVLDNNIQEPKSLHFDDSCYQETADAHIHDSFMYDESIPQQDIGPECNDTQGSLTMLESVTENLNFAGDCEEMEAPLLRSSRNCKPSLMNRQEDLNMTSGSMWRTNDYDFLMGKSAGQNNSTPNVLCSNTHMQEKSRDSHKKSPKLKCRACNISFKDLQSLQTHRKTHEGEKKYKCDVCPAKFFNTSHLKVHKRLHTGERPFVCDTCGESYVEASKLKAHMRKHTGERPYECKVCLMTFTWSAAFSRHKRIHTGEKPYSCDHCEATFADFTALQRHTRTHTKEKPYKCELCGCSFGDPSTLRMHKRIHTGERPYHCKLCSATFTRAQHVKEHIKLHLGEKLYKCETCGAAFVEASKLKSHMRRHTGEKPYQCNVCGASFAWTAAYTRHLRTHTFEKPYPCKVCGCTFADNSTLIRHLRTHTGERPYHCTLCGSCFADSSSLNRHQRIHSGEKAFTCEICGASFAIKSYLSRHIRIHTGEKPYGCDKCNSKFADSSKLKRHQKIHERLKMKQEKQHFTAAVGPPPSVYPPLSLSRHDIEHNFQDEDILSHLSKPCSYDHVADKPDHQFDPVQRHETFHAEDPIHGHKNIHGHEAIHRQENIHAHGNIHTHNNHRHESVHRHEIIHGHDTEVGSGLTLSFAHPHDESLDLATSVSASFGMVPGMETLANILSFDS